MREDSRAYDQQRYNFFDIWIGHSRVLFPFLICIKQDLFIESV